MKTNLKKICTLLIASQQWLETLLTGKTTRSPFELFNNGIISLYNFRDSKEHYTFGEFRDLFYNAVIFNTPLPNCVLEIIPVYFKGYMNTELSPDFYNSAVSEIKAEITNFRLQENAKDFFRKKNEIETASVRQLVFAHQHNFNSYQNVRPLIMWAENNNRLDYDFIYRMFEYGYIMGKRAERQKGAGQA